MENLKLVLPSDYCKFKYLDFIKECKKDIKFNGFEYCVPISNKDTIDNDIIILRNRCNGFNLPEG